MPPRQVLHIVQSFLASQDALERMVITQLSESVSQSGDLNTDLTNRDSGDSQRSLLPNNHIIGTAMTLVTLLMMMLKVHDDFSS